MNRQPIVPELSSAQARQRVNRFLLMEVSTLLAADAPELVEGERTVWRVPVWIGFLHQGSFAVGALDVDARTGAILDQAQRVAPIQARCVQESHFSNHRCESIMRWEVQHDQL